MQIDSWRLAFSRKSESVIGSRLDLMWTYPRAQKLIWTYSQKYRKRKKRIKLSHHSRAFHRYEKGWTSIASKTPKPLYAKPTEGKPDRLKEGNNWQIFLFVVFRHIYVANDCEDGTRQIATLVLQIFRLGMCENAKAAVLYFRYSHQHDNP